MAGEDHRSLVRRRHPVAPHGPRPANTLPLAGMRIIDLTMGWAGPTAARHLGDLGAEIIKVEACQYPDWWRGTDLRAAFIAEQNYEKIPWFQLMNRNKLDVTLDLTHPDGVALLKRLVAGADAVIENYSAEVLGKLGLDYTVLQERQSRIGHALDARVRLEQRLERLPRLRVDPGTGLRPAHDHRLPGRPANDEPDRLRRPDRRLQRRRGADGGPAAQDRRPVRARTSTCRRSSACCPSSPPR